MFWVALEAMGSATLNVKLEGVLNVMLNKVFMTVFGVKLKVVLNECSW